MRLKNAIALCLCATVCLSVLLVIAGAAFGGKTLTSESSAKMFDLVTYMLGTVAGYLLAQSKGD